MSSTTLPPAWAAPWRVGAPSARAGEAPAGGVISDADAAPCWVLRQRCSLSPRDLVGIYVALCAVVLGIGVAFSAAGAPMVLAFSGLEVVALGVAMLVHGTHAIDGEVLSVRGETLVVESRCGLSVRERRFALRGLRVRLDEGPAGLVVLADACEEVRVGRALRPEWRPLLASELRRAVACARNESPRAAG